VESVDIVNLQFKRNLFDLIRVPVVSFGKAGLGLQCAQLIAPLALNACSEIFDDEDAVCGKRDREHGVEEFVLPEDFSS